jgi:tRNA-2-methylthio-N6-dimethylallyladenosine synthase
MGYTYSEKEEEASLIGVIACSVRQKAIDKVYSKIHKWNKWKNKRSLITFVSGCILPDDKVKFLKLFDLVFDMGEVATLPDLMGSYGVVTPSSAINRFAVAEVNSSVEKQVIEPAMDSYSLRPLYKPDKPAKKTTTDAGFWTIEPHYQSSFEAFVPIQNGCDKFCTFCAVPYTRGREVSRASSEIIEEVRGLVEKGYKSITLLGQNVNSYGRDKTGSELNFAGLLQAIGELIERMRADVWVYFTSPHPRDMSREVIEVMARYKCLAKQVHLPLQSGDDKVLIRMNRKHSMTRYREIVGWIRELLPSATLFTDIIVGFTGETDEQFENTRQAMLEFSYNMAFIAMYSPRPGAASFRWNDDIGMEVKKLRHALLTKDLAQVAGAYNQSLVGNTLKVLVKGPDRKEGFLSGHTEGKTVVRFESSDLDLVGHFVELKILSATPFSAEGVRVDTHVKV